MEAIVIKPSVSINSLGPPRWGFAVHLLVFNNVSMREKSGRITELHNWIYDGEVGICNLPIFEPRAGVQPGIVTSKSDRRQYLPLLSYVLPRNIFPFQNLHGPK